MGGTALPERRTLARLLAALWAGVAVGAAAPEVTVSPPTPATADRVVDVGTLHYRTSIGERTCDLGYLPADQSLLLRTGPAPATMDELASCLAPLLDALLLDHPGVAQFSISTADRAALDARITAAVNASPDWNAKAGTPRRGTMSVLIRDAVNRQGLAKEITAVFAAKGYALSLQSVGMVWIEQVPAFENRRLPTDAALLRFTAKRSIGGQ